MRRAAPSFPRWQIARAQRLHRLCQRIEARVSSGQFVTRALVWGRPYRKGTHQRLTRGYLRSLYYRWQRGGRQFEAFLPQSVRSRGTKLPSVAVKRFRCALLAPGSRCVADAIHATGWSGRGDAFRRLLPSDARRALRSFYRCRRELTRLEARCRKLLAARSVGEAAR